LRLEDLFQKALKSLLLVSGSKETCVWIPVVMPEERGGHKRRSVGTGKRVLVKNFQCECKNNFTHELRSDRAKKKWKNCA